MMTGLRVGELAKRTGLSVRTLHHYEAIGLLAPSARTESGYRIYDAPEIARLQQIASLRQLGFSLDDIRRLLDDTGITAEQVLALHIRRIDEQLARQRELRERLSALVRLMRARRALTIEELLETIGVTSMVDKYYTDEQLEWLKQRGEAIGEDRIREVEAEWPRLMAEVRAEMEAGTDPADAKVQALMDRWRGLVAEFTGGNPGIEQSLNSFYGHEDTLFTGEAIDRELFTYVGRAMRG
jgi:MerR family transcriptional regulator, thiopeptide resistance regulator